MSCATITGAPIIIPLIRAECGQFGLSVDASRDNGKTWEYVQLDRYKTRTSFGVHAYATCVDPERDRQDYFAELDARGVRYKREKSAD